MTDGLRIEIRWRDLDVYGHVNNAVYLSYLEEARDRWLAATLGDSEEIWNWVLARVAIDYRTELTRADGAVWGTCGVARLGRSSVTTREVLRKADGTIAAEAEAVLVARDPGTGSSRPIRDDERALLEAVAAGGPAA